MSFFEKKDLNSLIPYRLSSHKVWEINSADVLKLDWNESAKSPSPKVKEEILKYLDYDNFNWYPNTKNEILLSLLQRYTGIEAKYIQYFSSSDTIHEYISRAFIDSGDGVLIVSPTYDNFRVVVESAGACVELFELDSDFNLDFELLNEELITNKFKLCYICNPNNPTGSNYSCDYITKLVISNPQVLFLVDEAYFEFSNSTVVNLCQSVTNLIVTRTFSKAFGLASFRIGYMISNLELIESINKIRNAKNIPMISQIAACAALNDIEYMSRYVSEVKEAKFTFVQELKSEYFKKHLYVYNSNANFVLIKVFNDRKKDLIYFLEKNNIFVRDVSLKLLSSDFIRITIGDKVQMSIVLNKIVEFIK